MDILDIANAVFAEIEADVDKTTKWKSDSKYRKIRHLQIDKRGSFGERLLRDIFSKERNISLEYKDGDQGDWDIKINDIRIEVKTSSLDVNDKFQNENIKNTANCDYICFIGIAPNAIFMKLAKIANIDFESLHNRGARGTGAGYKWDLKASDMLEVTTREQVVELFYATMGLDKKAIKRNLKK
ncbi:hypothetical protein CCY99_08920 [Helicobacter sp. 16-1353]|uniref:hypothetical protein n=1 Tax=Helicobacter sp. 16-1353 TaxID=2004996 RepID=UPI000DCBC7FB|nr:hypothetical protein [Helicobacter sp. 16-1353]RAX51484.1 hypothetical protein CCY99_08920 [Helicobacter sp. 16-1353]